eukprot:1192449-Prorocentrum_minimum.AAC.3
MWRTCSPSFTVPLCHCATVPLRRAGQRGGSPSPKNCPNPDCTTVPLCRCAGQRGGPDPFCGAGGAPAGRRIVPWADPTAGGGPGVAGHDEA